MLSIAKERFNGLDNFEYVEGDYTEDIPINTCSLICSALSIHHLEKPDRKQLYSTIFKKLDKGGCFINLDMFMAASPRINNLYTDWINYYTNKTGINGGAKTTKAKRQLLDKESTVRETIDLLKKCGFEDVECVYSFMKFGTIIAIKE
jgi:tRNA (cmo5U34)-methyltransferase